jgi:hypothetical protein
MFVCICWGSSWGWLAEKNTISRIANRCPESCWRVLVFFKLVGETGNACALTRFHGHHLNTADVPNGKVDEQKVKALNVKRLGVFVANEGLDGRANIEMAAPRPRVQSK